MRAPFPTTVQIGQIPRIRLRGARPLAIALLSFLTTMAALEIGFRLMPQFIPLEACRSSLTLAHAYCENAFRVYDRPLRLGYTFKPGYTYDGRWNPADPNVINARDATCGDIPDHTFHYVVRADDHGFVGNESPWRDHYDIVITGDSFTGNFAPVWWIDLLGQQTGMSVLNLGMEGWGPLSQVEAVRQYGLDKSPRWVVMTYFEGNDLFEVGEYTRRRESGLDWRTYQLHLVSPPERLIMPHMLRFWAESLWHMVDPEPKICRFPMTVSTNVHRFETVFFHTHIAQLSWSRERILASWEWQRATQAILALRDEVEAQGARFLLVFVPAKEHLYWSRIWDPVDIGHFLELTVPLLSYQEFTEIVDDQMELVEEFAAANNIRLLNLTGEMWRRTMLEGIEFYNYSDPHWNEAGNRLVAQLIARTILEAEREGS